MANTPIQLNELGAMHHRHSRRGWGKSHHLTGYPQDQSRIHVHQPLPNDPDPGEVGVVPAPLVGPQCNVGDAKCYVFDDFARSWAKPALVAGSSWAGPVDYGLASEWVAGNTLEYMGVDVTVGGLGWHWFGSFIGTWAFSHTDPGKPSWSKCTWFDFTFSGWALQGSWGRWVVGSHPANMAGAVVNFYTNDYFGVSSIRTCQVWVTDSQPTHPRPGTLVGTFANDGAVHSVFIPGHLIPAEGGSLYIMTAPGWDADYGEHACGFNWPWRSGVYNSGRAQTQLSGSMSWRTFSSGDTNLGQVPAYGDADEGYTDARPWWDGGNTLNLLGITGSPVDYGMDNGRLWLTADAPAGLSFSYEGEADAQGPTPGPWSWDGWAYSFDFRLDVASLPAEAGERFLSFHDINGNSEVKAFVYLGDTSHAAGIGLDAGNGLLYEPFTIAAGVRYGVRVDTRSGQARMRIWSKSDGEPATWMLRSALGEPTENGDRFVFSMFAGNGLANPDQTVSLYAWSACGMGGECYWVDTWLGVGDGTSVRFLTPQRYVPGSLRARVDGFWPGVREVDPYGGEFEIDHAPSSGAFLRAAFLVGESVDEG